MKITRVVFAALVMIFVAACDDSKSSNATKNQATEADGTASVDGSGQDSAENKEDNSGLPNPLAKASYGIGFSIGTGFMQDGLNDIDIDSLNLGVEDALKKAKPRLTEDQLMNAMSYLQKRAEDDAKVKGEAAAKEGQEFLEKNGQRKEVITTPSGLQYEILKAGKGEMPKLTDVVTVQYEGRLIDGTVFDSSYERGEPVDFPVSGVVPGWTEALQLMKVGEKLRLFIPSALAYGDQSPGNGIPPNSVLLFDMELQSIGPQEQDADDHANTAGEGDSESGDSGKE